MRFVELPNGVMAPALGLGTWRMGERGSQYTQEVAALQHGIDLGLTLIDTAEMYGEGDAEEVVGEAIAGRRDGLFLVSKVYPHNASRKGAIAACERSLKRLGVETIDLYLLHWRGGVPLAETVEAFEHLKSDGKIAAWGVSNFDAADMAELWALDQGEACVTNQVLYHLGERGIEWELIPRCNARRVPLMAYSPLGQGDILFEPAVEDIAEKHGVAPAAVALAWVLRQEGMIAIPKAANLDHVKANAAALGLVLEPADLEALDAAFPAPNGPSPLAII